MPEYYDELLEFSTAATAYAQSDNKSKKKGSPPAFFRSSRRIVYGDTGIQTNHYVGTADECLYFKAKVTCGATGPEGAILFYDNPRDYCTHYLTTLSKKKYPKGDFMVIRENIEAMLNDMAPVVQAWTKRRDEYLAATQQTSQ